MKSENTIVACFHNIWGWSEVERVGPIAPRCRLMKEFYLKSCPDVICLQEFLTGFRLTENDSVLLSLKDFQYEEADVGTVVELTPHHKRICPTATPILYRKDKLKLLRCGVHKFDIYNGGGADKFATWAVFQTVDEKKFGIMSVHMAYEDGDAGDRFRLLQAQKVMEIVTELKKQESCPIIFGGDLNSLPTSQSYAYFANQQGCFDVRSLAMEADDTATHFGGPLWDSEKNRYCPHDDIRWGEYLNGAYDHVFCVGKKVSFLSFRVICNELTRSISDHVPIMLKMRF